MKPDVRITWNDGFAIAYQVVGSAPRDLVYLPGFESNVELMWDIPIYRHFLEELASFSRLITVDRRGAGCSDRLPPGVSPTLEEIADDVLAAMGAANSPHATLFATQEAAFPAMLLAATHPSQVDGLVLFGASPSWARSDELPDEWSAERWETQHRSVERSTNATDFADGYIRSAAPSLFGDEAAKRALAGLFLNTAGIGAATAESKMFSELDLRDTLPSIAAPTLVLRRKDDEVTAASSARFLAEHVQRGEFVEIAGRDSLPWIGDQQPVLEAVQRFMGAERSAPVSDRRLASILFTDIVDSTGRATALGDAGWARVLGDHNRAVRDALAGYGGTEVDTAGDGFFATFDGPAQAVRCAVAICRATADLGISVRAGVHTGEVETIEGKPGGAAVIVGARVAATAGPDQVLVSQTVKDLVAGSGLSFEDAGEHELKGVPDRWHLYRVAS